MLIATISMRHSESPENYNRARQVVDKLAAELNNINGM
jgi:hypothetical protein